MGAESGIVSTTNERVTEDLRVVKTRRALHDALKRLMAKHEYSKISVTLLANEALVNRKTFYSHYSSIDDIVAEVFSENIRDMCQRAVDIASSGGERRDFSALTPLLLASLDENVDEELNLIRSLSFQALRNMVINPLEEFAIAERERRGLPKAKNLRANIACYAGCVLAGYAQWRLDEEADETLDDVAARVNRMAASIASEVL